jgi:hypothetical protein
LVDLDSFKGAKASNSNWGVAADPGWRLTRELRYDELTID